MLVLLHPFSLLPPPMSVSARSAPWRWMSPGGSSWTPLRSGVWWTQPAEQGAGRAAARLHPCRPACTPVLAALLQTALPAGGSSCSALTWPGHTGLSPVPLRHHGSPAGPGALPPVGSLMALDQILLHGGLLLLWAFSDIRSGGSSQDQTGGEDDSEGPSVFGDDARC